MSALAPASPLHETDIEAPEIAPDTLWRRIVRSPRIALGGGLVAAILLICFATLPWTLRDSSSIYYNRQTASDVRHPPEFHTKFPLHLSRAYLWFGADVQGRSLLGRCLLGGAISLAIGCAAAIISMLLGVSIGLIAGYRGGWIDAVLMRLVDILYGLPYILLIILFKVAFENANSIVLLFCAIGAVSWLTMARVVRGQVLSLRAQPFIEAARAAGLKEGRIFLRHLLPNLIGPIAVYATLIVPQAILQESFLSFLGVGIKDPLPTWGSLASDGLEPALNGLHSEWWMLFFPCLLLAITLLALNFLGDGLRDVFDPRKEAAKI